MSEPEQGGTLGRDAPGVTAEGEALPSDPRRIRYLGTPAPAAGSCARITDGLLWARLPLPIDLNHINVWLLERPSGFLAIDTGMAASVCKDAWEQIERDVFAHKPLEGVFVTHVHPDHLGLAAWLRERHRVPVWMSSRAQQTAQAVFSGNAFSSDEVEAFLRQHGVPDLAPWRALFRPERFVRMTSGLPHVERLVEDGARIDWGRAQWEAMGTDGHAEGHLCLYNKDAGHLISGDQILPTISSNVSIVMGQRDPNPLRSYLESLDRLRALPADTLVLPSHGLPFHGLRQRIEDLQAHHQRQLAKVDSACVEPRTAYELLPVLFKRELGGMHLLLALGEAIAHLEYLADAGRLDRRVENGVLRYARFC